MTARADRLCLPPRVRSDETLHERLARAAARRGTMP